MFQGIIDITVLFHCPLGTPLPLGSSLPTCKVSQGCSAPNFMNLLYFFTLC